MTSTLVLEQFLNGLQFGLMLFLLAAGLTLVFGIMDMINLAHGSLYMLGAFVAASLVQATGSFAAGGVGRVRRHPRQFQRLRVDGHHVARLVPKRPGHSSWGPRN